jgi:hypothetical protein
MQRGRAVLNLLILFSVIFFSQFVLSYEYDASNISIDAIQVIGEPISGNFVLSLADAPINLVFSSEFGNITLRDLLVNEGKSLGCEDYNCSGIYSTVDSGATSISLEASPSGVAYGLLFTGMDVLVESFDVSFSSQFEESENIPLSIQIGRDSYWYYNTPSNNITNYIQMSYGCFNPATVLTNGNINSLGYCEEVNLTGASSYYLGANMSGSGVADFVFSLNKGGVEIGNCLVPVSSATFADPIGCFVNLNDKQSTGKFEVCVRKQEDNANVYSVKKETAGTNCGSYAGGAKVADYSIFAKVPYYSSLNGEINLGEDFSSFALDSINSYISQAYGGKCSSGCVVPIIFYGNNVRVNSSALSYQYTSNSGPEAGSRFYSLLEDVYRTSFSEVISLSSFNWIVDKQGNSSFNINLIGDGANNKLFSRYIFANIAPIVTYVYPLNPPAGLDVYFYSVIENNFTKLVWDFGDGSSAIESTQSYIKHKYANVSSNYNLSITAYDSNSSTKKTFIVETVSPENYINETLDKKRALYNKINLDVNNLTSFYRDFVRGKLQLDFIQNEFNQIEILRASALSSNDFLNIVNRITSLPIPVSFNAYESKSGVIDFSYSLVDPSYVAEIIPGDYGQFEEYKSPIYTWQLKNIQSSLIKRKFRSVDENGIKTEVMTSYDLSINSKSEETSYLIIQEPLANLHFSSEVSAKDINGKASYISILSLEEKTFSFFVEGSKDIVMFVSPSLESILLISDVSVCVVNDICQKNNGENVDNCPQDCKNRWPLILSYIILLLLLLVIYTALQFWYVVRYEVFLFKDRTYLFNLLAFINNAKLNNRSKDWIYSTLTSNGWSNEQVDYAFKKSDGKNTGMFELLPVQKIVANLEMKKAREKKNERVVPPVSNYQKPLPGKFVPRLPPKINRPNLGQNIRRDTTKI